MSDFFVSYTQADATWAEWISFVLEENAYKCIVQAWDFRPGTNFVLQMQQAVTSAKRTLVVLSQDYDSSAFAQPEWAAAFARDPLGANSTIVPVRVGPCEPQGLLGQIVNLNLVGLDESSAARTLLDGISSSRMKPAGRPRFPQTDDSGRPRPKFPGEAGTRASLSLPKRTDRFVSNAAGMALLFALQQAGRSNLAEALGPERVNEIGKALELSERVILDLIEALRTDGLVSVQWGGRVSLTRLGNDRAEQALGT